MSRNEISGYVSLLYSVADKPLDLWSKHVSYGGKVRRVKDDLLHGDRVIEITGPHDSTIPTSITIPAKALDVLNVKLPVLVLVVKNLNLRFKLELQVIDKGQYRRRFSFITHNDERPPSIRASVARVPLRLAECWNFLEINLQTLCRDAYGTDYEALQRVTIYPNCHLRRVYLQDRHYNDDEIPVEMCQAFFDMYMLKWGINFIEKACQTEDFYTGSLEQSDLNRFAKGNSISTPLTKVDLCKTANSMEKPKSLNSSMNLNLYNSNISKRNWMSLEALNGAIKKRNQHVFTRQSECFTKSSINDPVIENKIEKCSSDIMEKAEQHYATKTRKTGNSSLNVNFNSHTLQFASSIDLKRIAKSQYLKTHVSEILFKDYGLLSKRLQKIQSERDTYVNLRNYTLNNDANYMQTGKDKSMVAKFNRAAVVGSLPVFKLDQSENIKPDKINKNVSDASSDGHVRSKYEYVKESEKSIASCLGSLVSIKEDITDDIFTHKRIPSLIENEAKLEETKSQNTYLTTDKTVPDFITIGRSAKRKLLEKLQAKGLSKPHVDLLIYNMTNRGNSYYGQQKFIERQRWCIDKCIGSQ